jgi:hypothetical protein
MLDITAFVMTMNYLPSYIPIGIPKFYIQFFKPHFNPFKPPVSLIDSHHTHGGETLDMFKY